LILIDGRVLRGRGCVSSSMRKILLIGLLGACTPKYYYVANLYQSHGLIYVEKCPVYNNGRGDSADPHDCHIAPIPELPVARVSDTRSRCCCRS
jgi:hypothetical protein